MGDGAAFRTDSHAASFIDFEHAVESQMTSLLDMGKLRKAIQGAGSRYARYFMLLLNTSFSPKILKGVVCKERHFEVGTKL